MGAAADGIERAMLTDSQFFTLGRDTLTRLHDALEPSYDSGTLEELELEAGLLTIVTQAGQSFIVSAHAPSQQIWLASPISGGLHFRWSGESWILGTGETIEEVLARELQVAL